MLLPSEKEVVLKAFIDPLVRFVGGHGEEEENIGWGTRGYREMRTLKYDGTLEVWDDGLWDGAVRVWGMLRGVGEPGGVVDVDVDAKL